MRTTPNRASISILLTLCSLGCSDSSTNPTDAGDTTEDAGVVFCGTADEQLLVTTAEVISSCDWARGAVHVPDWNETSLPFTRLRRVDGRFTFFRPHHLPNFRGLDRLEHVGGEFSVRLDNAGELVSFDGLEALREVGALTIDNNGGLTDIRALSGLEHIRGDVNIRDNTALPSAQVEALLATIEIDGTVNVSGNKP